LGGWYDGRFRFWLGVDPFPQESRGHCKNYGANEDSHNAEADYAADDTGKYQ
jgi:hypothetical protein